MERDPESLLLPPAPGMFGSPPDTPPPLRIHAIERELHMISSALGRMANAEERIAPSLETIAKELAVLRKIVERGSR